MSRSMGVPIVAWPCACVDGHVDGPDTVQPDALHWNVTSRPLGSPKSRGAPSRGIFELVEEVEPDGEQILALPNLARCCLSCTA
jgi:hypothetical protein